MDSALPTFHWSSVPVDRVWAAKRDQRVSVVLPARDEAATIGPIVETIRHDLVEGVHLVDELLVVDDHSTDDTAAVATAAGARVVAAGDVLPGVGSGIGKGEALWRGVHVATGDVVVFCDGDIVDFQAQFVVGLLGPLLTNPDLGFVKGFYDRPVDDGERGGRVTELLARPLLATLFPHLATVVQPLSGEYAGRRGLLRRLPFVGGYGVDLALLIDAAALIGTHRVAQVDLGVRRHRNRPLSELGPQATTVLQAALSRAGVPFETAAMLVQPGELPDRRVHRELPPLDSLSSGRAAS